MHENAPILEAKSRERVGSRYARRVRKAGGLPAVVSGHKKEWWDFRSKLYSGWEF